MASTRSGVRDVDVTNDDGVRTYPAGEERADKDWMAVGERGEGMMLLSLTVRAT